MPVPLEIVHRQLLLAFFCVVFANHFSFVFPMHDYWRTTCAPET